MKLSLSREPTAMREVKPPYAVTKKGAAANDTVGETRHRRLDVVRDHTLLEG
jgi:hypothetical protein